MFQWFAYVGVKCGNCGYGGVGSEEGPCVKKKDFL